MRFMPIRVNGWGVSSRRHQTTPVLQSVELPYVTPEKCSAPEAYGQRITPEMLCAGTDEYMFTGYVSERDCL